MPIIRGCLLPEDLYYWIDRHVWAQRLANGLVRVGFTSVAATLIQGPVVAVRLETEIVGQQVTVTHDIATIETASFAFPMPAPITGVLSSFNNRLRAEPNLVVADPYGEGWIAEISPENWEVNKEGLVTGPEGLDAYRHKMEADGLSC